MSRTTRIAALLTALSVTGASALMAQSTDSTRTPPPRARRQMGDSIGAPRGQFPRERGFARGGGPGTFGARGRGFAGGPGGGPMSFGGRGGMLRGITLSDAQRKSLTAGRVKHLTSMKPLQVEMISARADAEIAQLNGDQKALDAANARLTSAREQMGKLMQDRSPTTDLRNVLTPDQQKIFDKNLSDGMQRRASMMRMPRGRGMGQMRGMGPMRGMPGMRGPGTMNGLRGGMMRRGFGPGAPGAMPGEGMRPGMGPRRYDDDELSDDDRPGAFDDEFAMGPGAPMFFSDRMGDEMMDDIDDLDDVDDMDDLDVFGWGDYAPPPPQALAPRAVLPPPDRRP